MKAVVQLDGAEPAIHDALKHLPNRLKQPDPMVVPPALDVAVACSFGKSYHGDVLQYAKKLFLSRLLQMTKYFVMRECENIPTWISLV